VSWLPSVSVTVALVLPVPGAFDRPAIAALFEEAAAALKPDPGSTGSQLFRMFLALSSELHQVRGRISIAANQSREGHPGAACADLLVGTPPPSKMLCAHSIGMFVGPLKLSGRSFEGRRLSRCNWSPEREPFHAST